ncbi:hypothetical protein [Streptomyces sp. NPDC094032]|uniref:hypothetical protein n=1 Tax=Streptomyces sp. NPDC094032 TaxID=3155308 RepID=UPI003325688A
MTVPALRPLLSTAVAALVVGSAALAGAPTAFAAPGDNGDVKIHNSGTSPDSNNDEPKVCRFYLAAFNFDGLQEVSWDISPQPPKADSPNLSGKITLDAQGNGHTSDLLLPDGQYKLDWTFVGENGAGKHKVFQVDCSTTPPTTPPPTTGGNGNGGGGNGGGGNGGGGNGGGGNGGGGYSGGSGHHKPPHGPVGAGGGGSADTTASDDGSGFGVGSALAAGLAGTAGLILIRRARRRNDGAA